MNEVSNDLQNQFRHPLAHLDSARVHNLYRKIIFWAVAKIVLGLGLLLLVPWLGKIDDWRHLHSPRQKGFYTAGLTGTIGLILLCYGIWQLVTLKARVQAQARRYLLLNNPELKPLDEEYRRQLVKNWHKALKIAMLPIILIVVALVVYSVILVSQGNPYAN